MFTLTTFTLTFKNEKTFITLRLIYLDLEFKVDG